MVSKCPTTEKSWGRKSAAKGCSPKENYHCVQTQDGDLIELCTNAIWIEMGNCPVYNRAGNLESKVCQARVLQTACPTNVYRSNQVFKYTACFPENSISTTSAQTSTLIGKQTIILNTTTIPTSEDAKTGLAFLALLILIPFMLAFLVVLYLQRRGYIKIHRLCTNGRERSGESSELKSSADKGHRSIDIGENKDESEKFLPDDTNIRNTTDEHCNTAVEDIGSPLPGCSIEHFVEKHALNIKEQPPSARKLSSHVRETISKETEKGIDVCTKGREVQQKESLKEKDSGISIYSCIPSNCFHLQIFLTHLNKKIFYSVGSYIPDTDIKPSNVSEKSTHKTGKHLNTSIEPSLSMVKRMSEVLSSKDMLVITGLPGSGKTTLALKITEAACRRFTEGANLRDIKDLEQLDEMMCDKETFLILDDCIKSWFNEIYLNIVFKKISGVLQSKRNRVHVLLCASPGVWSKYNKLLLSSSLQCEVLNLSDFRSYKECDWDKIFNWHMQRNIELTKSQNQVEMNIKMWMEEYRKHEAKEIGKPTIAYLLCRSVKTLENPTFLFKDPRKFLESEISRLVKWSLFGPNNYRPFVVLVYLMLHNGKAKPIEMNSKIIDDICSAYKISKKHVGSVIVLNYDEIEVKHDEMSVRSKEVVRATFDFVWKDHKDLIIRYCDNDLFLERITLKESTEQEVTEIARRFKSMMDAGKSNVEHHYLLENPSFKRLVQQ